MKKALILLPRIIIFTFLSLSISAQVSLDNSIASSSNNFSTEENNVLKMELAKKSKLKNIEIPNAYIPISIDESALKFKVSKDFGSYIIPNTNYLKIVASDSKVYTDAELINKDSKVRVFFLPLDMKKNVVDMTYTKPGRYTLTLTNTNGDKYSEDILIM